MNIPKSRKDLIIAVCVAVLTGVVGDAIWDGIKHLASTRVGGLPLPHAAVRELFQLSYFVAIGLVGVFLGRRLERGNVALWGSSPLEGPSQIEEADQSKVFVLEVEGTQPLDSGKSDWKFFLTNCTYRILRDVELYNVRSDIGTYQLGFHEIPVMQPGQRVELAYELFSRRLNDIHNKKKPRLWDFATDHTIERGTTFIWYDILTRYREADSDRDYNGGFVAVCFDLHAKKLKTEGAAYYRQDRKEIASFRFAKTSNFDCKNGRN